MTYNAFDAERRRRHQQITGKIGADSHTGYQFAYSTDVGAAGHDAASIAMNHRRGHLTSLGEFVNQPTRDV
jgi:hypothetical protein